MYKYANTITRNNYPSPLSLSTTHNLFKYFTSSILSFLSIRDFTMILIDIPLNALFNCSYFAPSEHDFLNIDLLEFIEVSIISKLLSGNSKIFSKHAAFSNTYKRRQPSIDLP